MTLVALLSSMIVVGMVAIRIAPVDSVIMYTVLEIVDSMMILGLITINFQLLDLKKRGNFGSRTWGSMVVEVKPLLNNETRMFLWFYHINSYDSHRMS